MCEHIGVHYSHKNLSLDTYKISMFIFYKKIFHPSYVTNGRLQLMVVYNLLFAIMLIFSHCVTCN
jgi:hypothetical protein